MTSLIFAQIFLHGCMTGTRLAASLLALKQGYGAAAIGTLMALFAISQGVLALPAGKFTDRCGLRRPVRYSVILATVGAGAAAAFPFFISLLFAALLTGAATVLALVAIQRHAGRAAHEAVELKKVFGWLSIGTAASNFIGPFMVGILIDHAGPVAGSDAGYRWAFALMAIFPSICWLLLRRTLELPAVVTHAPNGPQGMFELLRAPLFRRLMIANCVLQSCWDIHTFALPLLAAGRGISASLIGVILGSFAIAAAAVRFLLPLIAAHLKEWVVILVSMIVTCGIFAIYPLMRCALGMGCCAVLLGLTLGMVQPMVMSMLHQITPQERHGEAIGFRLMAISASSVVIPAVFGFAGAFVGVSGIFWMSSLAVGVSSRNAWLLQLRTGS